MNTQLVLKGKEDFRQLMTTARESQQELAAADEIMRPVAMAMAISAYRSLLTKECLTAIRQLSGTTMGFAVDREDYPDDVIRNAVIEALMQNVSIVGNEFNIIGGNFYVAKNGWLGKLKKVGCTQIVPSVGAPEDVSAGQPNQRGFRRFTAQFKASASCMKGGQKYSVTAGLDKEIDTRLEATAFGRDLSESLSGLKGKAEARILRRLFYHCSDAVEPAEDLPPVVDLRSIPVHQDVPDEIIDPELVVAADAGQRETVTESLEEAFTRRLNRIREERGNCGVVTGAKLIMEAKTLASVARTLTAYAGNLEQADADLLAEIGNWKCELLHKEQKT